MGLRDAWNALLGRDAAAEVREAAPAGDLAAPKTPERSGFEYGIPRGGLTETRQSMGSATQSDRRTLMQQLYEAYLACPWAWAATNAVARTITAGGLAVEWDGDDEEGDKEAPPKPDNVQALERLFAYTNPREDIRQLLRGVIVDLEVFGDAFIEVVWVGSLPVALYSLDSPSMLPLADEHGMITGYVQVTEFGQRATFEAREVIHISLDSPRSGIYGVSPTQANLLPITAWLFAAATAKEVFRKGNPPNIHVDFPAGTQQPNINRWLAMYAAQNVGPRNIGTPIVTVGGGKVDELQQGKIPDYLAFLDQKRDEILAGYGVPPAQAGVIESGNLGGGTGESQRKMFEVNTCQPLAELVLEKIQYAIVRMGFGITDWHIKFGTVDLRDSKTVEDIRDMRVRNGTYTINKARAEIGEPRVDGGDNAVLVDRQNLVMIRDLEAYSTAGLAAKLKGLTDLAVEEPEEGQPVKLVKPEPKPLPPALAAAAGLPAPGGDTGGGPGGNPSTAPAAGGGKAPLPGQPAAAGTTGGKAGGKKVPVAETALDRDWAAISEAWTASYLDRRDRALAELPVHEHAAEPGDSPDEHHHHNDPDYRAADLGLPDDLHEEDIDPVAVGQDHEHYQRDLDEAKVEALMELPDGELAARTGLLARRPDGTLWCVDGQHLTVAAARKGIRVLTYQVFDSTGWQQEARVFAAWQTWDASANLAVRGDPQLAGAVG